MMKRILVLGLVLGGCSGPASPTGQVTVALVAPGGGGVTYRLPPGTQLQLTSDSFAGFYNLDAEAPEVTLNVPAGTYNAVLANPGGGYTTAWPLSRTSGDGMTTDTVTATTNPAGSIVVVDEQVTNYAIHFQISVAQVITFAHGEIDVTVSVDQVAATAYQFDISIASADGPSTFSADTPPDLVANIPGEITGFQDVVAHTNGPFAWVSRRSICAPAAVGLGTGVQAMADVFNELDQMPDGVVCVNQVTPSSVIITISADVQSLPATTGTFSAEEQRLLTVTMNTSAASLNLTLWDITGATPTTLDLGRLVGSFALGGDISVEVDGAVGGATPALWFAADPGGDATLTVMPL